MDQVWTIMCVNIKKGWLTKFTVDDLIDAYMILFRGNINHSGRKYNQKSTNDKTLLS